MSKNIAAELLLATLDEVDVSQHAVFLEGLGQFVRDCRVRMKAGKGDELQNESEAVLAE